MPRLSEKSGADSQLRRVSDLEQRSQICHRRGRGKKKGSRHQAGSGDLGW